MGDSAENEREESRRVLPVVALKLRVGLIMPMDVPAVDETHGHDHFHGTLDPALPTSEKGIGRGQMVDGGITAHRAAAKGP